MGHNSTTRDEHLEWCKERAIEIAEAGDIEDAFASMAQDLGKHHETDGHPAIKLGFQMMVFGHLSTKEQMIQFIRDFN